MLLTEPEPATAAPKPSAVTSKSSTFVGGNAATFDAFAATSEPEPRLGGLERVARDMRPQGLRLTLGVGPGSVVLVGSF